VFVRSSYDATANERLSQYLQKYDTVVVQGLETDACVLATAYGIFSLGLRPIVLKELCMTENMSHHEDAVSMLERNIGSRNVVTEHTFRESIR